MKPQNQNQLGSLLKTAGALAFGVATLCLAGCASTPYHKGDAAAVSLQDGAFEVQGQSRALEVTIGSLHDLVYKPEPDLRPQFKRFSKALDNLTACEKRNERSQEHVRNKSADYLEAWNQELATMNYEAVRSRSQERKAEVTTSFDSVNRRYHDAQDAMGPLLSYLYDVRRALAADLTPNGLESIKPVVAKARENADKVQLALGRLTTELASSSAHMSSVVYQNGSPGARTNQPPRTAQAKQTDGS